MDWQQLYFVPEHETDNIVERVCLSLVHLKYKLPCRARVNSHEVHRQTVTWHGERVLHTHVTGTVYIDTQVELTDHLHTCV